MNTIEEEIGSLNCQMVAFVEQLRNFRSTHNVVNKSLVLNMLKVVEEVNEFIEGDPKPTKENTKELDLNYISYRNVLQCNLCKAIFENSMYRHVRSPRHETKLIALKAQQKPVLRKEPSDSSDIDSDEEQITTKNLPSSTNVLNPHVSSKYKPQDVKHKAISLPADIQRILQSKETLENYINSMMAESNPSMYAEFVEKFKNTFPNFQVYMCGPLAFGLQNFYSTQEVFVDTGNSFYEYPPKAQVEIRERIKTIISALNEQKEWIYLKEDESSDYPILHTKLSNHPIMFTLIFSNGLSYYKSLLVKYLISLHPLVLKTCILLQKVITDSNLRTYFDSYVVALIVISQYQKQRYLPSVRELQKMCSTVVEIGPWQANFEMFLASEYKTKLKELTPAVHAARIKSFFRNVNKRILNPSQNLMSPFLGDVSFRARKFEKNFTENPNLKRYHDFCAKSPSSEHLEMNSALCLQDPIELNINLTGHIPKSVLENFKSILDKVWAELPFK